MSLNWLGLDWKAILTQAIAGIPAAIIYGVITGSVIFWTTHVNKQVAEKITKRPKNEVKDV